MPQTCQERFPVERDVKADPGHHEQRGQPVEVQPGEASEAEHRRAKRSLANVEVDEKKHSARERQERGDKEDTINQELELIARHALSIGTGARSRAVQPTNRALFQANLFPPIASPSPLPTPPHRASYIPPPATEIVTATLCTSMP